MIMIKPFDFITVFLSFNSEMVPIETCLTRLNSKYLIHMVHEDACFMSLLPQKSYSVKCRIGQYNLLSPYTCPSTNMISFRLINGSYEKK